MHYSEARKGVYVLWHRRANSMFSCTVFYDIASIDQAAELWDEIEKLSTPDHRDHDWPVLEGHGFHDRVKPPGGAANPTPGATARLGRRRL